LTKTAELPQVDSEKEQTSQPYVAPPRFHLDLMDYATLITFLVGIGGIVYSFFRR
jgi:hypothetical protein